ncbi:hypothetical protein [Gordonia sp. NPDC003376]
MIVVIESGTARVTEPHDYTRIGLSDGIEPSDAAVALAHSGLGGVDGDRVRLHIPSLARALRSANAYSERWFGSLIGCAAVWGWLRSGDDLVRAATD